MKPTDFFDLPSVPLSDAASLPGVQGIYAVISAGKIVYLGASSDMRKRWQTHHKTIEILAFSAPRIAYVEWPRYDIWSVEGELIQELDPPLNVAGRRKPSSGERRPILVPSPRVQRQKLTTEDYRRIAKQAEELDRRVWSCVTLYPSRGTTRYRFVWGVGGETVQTTDIKGGNASNPVVLRRVETARRWIEAGEPPWRVAELLAHFPAGQIGRPRKT